MMMEKKFHIAGVTQHSFTGNVYVEHIGDTVGIFWFSLQELFC